MITNRTYCQSEFILLKDQHTPIGDEKLSIGQQFISV